LGLPTAWLIHPDDFPPSFNFLAFRKLKTENETVVVSLLIAVTLLHIVSHIHVKHISLPLNIYGILKNYRIRPFS
jgi:hypothetical protein